jgi:hypothetical protein
MALSFLQLTNRVLKRITQSEITDVATATGHALIITELINEAQNALYSEANWHSLYTTSTVATVASTATVAAPTLGRIIDLIDTTNNKVLIEDVVRAIDEADPDADHTGTPTHFALQGANFVLYPIPAGVYTLRYRYWKIPTALTANANTSSLPIDCENCIIQYVLAGIHEYLKNFDASDRAWVRYKQFMTQAKKANSKVLDRMRKMEGSYYSRFGIEPVRLPSTYGYYPF